MTNSTIKFLLSILLILLVFCFTFFRGNPKLENEEHDLGKAHTESTFAMPTKVKTSKLEKTEKLTSPKHHIRDFEEKNQDIDKEDITEAFEYANTGHEGPDDRNLIDEVFEQFRGTDISEEGMDAWISAVFPEEEDIEKPSAPPSSLEDELKPEETPTQDEFQEAFFKELLKSDMPEDQAQALANEMFLSDEVEAEIDLESLVNKYSGEVILIVDILKNSGVPPEEMEAAIEEILGD